MSWAEFVLWLTYGFSFGAVILVNLILYSTILRPPVKGASPTEQIRTFVLRLPFAVVGIVSLMPLRPLRLAYDQHELAGAIIFLCFVVLTVVIGLKVLLPRFVTIKTMTDD
ncbi:MAG TPA: hypothetical protein VKP89_15910 [Burkholderiales bacterium]|nr:hypothetical protein [Burkholderiales bacterium]